jgi:hypothetical protein
MAAVALLLLLMMTKAKLLDGQGSCTRESWAQSE